MTRSDAAYYFRRDAAAAIAAYHNAIRTTWRQFGKPTTSEPCRLALLDHWGQFQGAIEWASYMMNRRLGHVR